MKKSFLFLEQNIWKGGKIIQILKSGNFGQKIKKQKN